MLFTKPQILFTYLKVITAGLSLLFVVSCAVVPKNYQPNKPFVYEYKINIEGNFTKEERNDLESRLENQLDDSIHIRTIPQLYRQVLKNPPLFDSTAADRSVLYMRALLNALGYFRDTIGYETDTTFKAPDQLRTSVIFNVRPGKLTRIDSITYDLDHADLQHLADSTQPNSFLKKGSAFSKATIANELDRLVELYRSNGYMRFSREELMGLWDTLDVSLLRPTLDPFEQLEILQKLSERRQNPTANLEIRLRPGVDSNRLTKYFIGDITVYPDFNRDTLGLISDSTMAGKVKVVYYRNLFRPKIFPPNIYLEKGELYRQRNYFKTINRFNSLGAWNLVNIEQLPRRGDDTVDFRIKLSPAKKYAYSATLEGSINQTPFSGNLFGVAVNIGLQNRNFAKSSNNANTNLRYGVELGSDSAKSFIQTRQLSFSHNISFPRVIFIRRIIPKKYMENARTVLSFNAASTERRLLYNLNTVNGSWGYEFQWRNKSLSVRLPNIEYSQLNKRDSLEKLIDNNPSLRNIFTDGFVSSIIGSYTVIGGKNNNLNVFRTNAELSGLLTGIIRSKFLDTNLYRFLKVDADFARRIQIRKTSVVLRLFAGVGYEFNSTKHPDKKNNLPFFKQYFAGGPNSMRAWRLRQLGPGSVIKQFSGQMGTPDRYGDVQLEGNAEYRFPITKIAGIRLNGALFTDIGNIWFLKSAASPSHPEEVFSFSRLGKDIAVGVGAGLRVDFGFFVVRLDYAYKAKDPSPRPEFAYLQNKWFGYSLLDGDQFQLGINYPFISDLLSK